MLNPYRSDTPNVGDTQGGLHSQSVSETQLLMYQSPAAPAARCSTFGLMLFNQFNKNPERLQEENRRFSP